MRRASSCTARRCSATRASRTRWRRRWRSCSPAWGGPRATLVPSGGGGRAAANGVQIHGGYGFTREYLVERIYRDVKLCTIGEGTSEVQRLGVAPDPLTAASRGKPPRGG